MNSTAVPPEIVDHFISRARQLFSLPAVALRVLELTSEPTVDTKAMTACIENDPALTSKILRVVNSSLFATSHRISNLNQALALLGTQPLKMLVLGFSLPTNLASEASVEVLERYWKHALLKAVAAREIAESWYGTLQDEAFVAGLLQDLGLLVLVQDLGDTFEKFLLSVWQDGADLGQEEVDVLGFRHTHLSARLLDSWHLPPTLIEAIEQPFDGEHLHSRDPMQQRLPQILHLAELMAAFLIDHRPGLLQLLLHTAQEYCGKSLAELESLVRVLEEKAPQLAEVLSLRLPPDQSYTAILLRAHQRIAELHHDAPATMLAPSKRPAEFVEQLRRTPSHTPGPHVEIANGQGANARGGGPVVREAEAPRPNSPATRVLDGGTSVVWSTREAVLGRLSAAIARCRQARAAVTLMLIELDEFNQIGFHVGLDGLAHIVRELGLSIQRIVETDACVLQSGDARYTIILDGWERRKGVDLAWRILDGLRHGANPEVNRRSLGISISVGLATLAMPPRNFPTEELLTAAERCLSGVQLSGGDSVKSIDIY